MAIRSPTVIKFEDFSRPYGYFNPYGYSIQESIKSRDATGYPIPEYPRVPARFLATRYPSFYTRAIPGNTRYPTFHTRVPADYEILAIFRQNYKFLAIFRQVFEIFGYFPPHFRNF